MAPVAQNGGTKAESAPDNDLLRLAQDADSAGNNDSSDPKPQDGERNYDWYHRKPQKKQVEAEEEDEQEAAKRFSKLKFLLQKSGVYAQIMQKKMDQEREQRIKDSHRSAAKAKSAGETSNVGKDGAINRGVAKGVVTGRSTRAGGASDKGQSESTTATRSRKPDNRAAKRRAEEAAGQISAHLDESDIKAAQKQIEEEKKASTSRGKEEEGNGDAAATPPIAGQRIQPAAITGATLKDYQLEGLDWLISLYENGLNGILADEMGLGKTIQTISFLAHLRSKGVWGPFMVVAPKSVASNWVREINRFTSDMPAVVYHGDKNERNELLRTVMKVPAKGSGEDRMRFPIVVTTYEMVIRDLKELQGFKWKFIIVDEGHRLKNMNCRLIQELKKLDSANRLLLTGTPLHNNLQELWSLLNFILPEIFDDLETFNKWFDFSDMREEGGSARIIKKENTQSIVSQLHEILKPFLLRRLKKDVLDLPPKKEYILYTPLTKKQKVLYDALLDNNIRGHLLEEMTGFSRAEIDELLGEEEGEKLVWGGSAGPSRRPTPPTPSSGTATPKRKRGRPPKASAPATPAESITISDDEDEGTPAKKTRGRKAKRGVTYEEESEARFLRRLEKEGEAALIGRRRPEKPPTREELIREGKLHAIRMAKKDINNLRLQNLAAQARKVCCHPFLFHWPKDRYTGEHVVDEQLIDASGKMLMLNRLLDALLKEDRKVLIFSQFTTVLTVLEDWLRDFKGLESYRIDGQTDTPERDSQMAAFNADKGPNAVKIFLLSTRAGGLGVNLVGADTVIFYDSDWNPQVDLQAQDRAHRIGQTKPVLVFRLITANTIEQHLLRTATSKRELEKVVIQDEKFLGLGKGANANGGAGGGKGGKKSAMSLMDSILKLQVEKINLAERGDEIISDANLKQLLDRSDAAFARKTGWVSSKKGDVRENGAVKDEEKDTKDMAFEVSESVAAEPVDEETERIAQIFRE